MQKSLPVAGLKLYFSLTKSTHPSDQLPSLLHSWLAFIGYFTSEHLFDNAIKNGKMKAINYLILLYSRKNNFSIAKANCVKVRVLMQL